MQGLPNNLSASSAGAASRVLPALRAAAERAGVDFEALYHTARLESGFNPDARARTSSATGLFQFIDSTWMSTLAKHGARHGIAPESHEGALELRRDPGVASLMAAEHMADNAATLEAGLGREATPTGLYLAHFLGAGGAVRFLKGMAADPAAAAAELFPAAARANRSIFYSESGARSLHDVHALFARKLGVEAWAGAGDAGGAPSGVAPSGVAPSGVAPSGVAPSGVAPDAAAKRDAALAEGMPGLAAAVSAMGMADGEAGSDAHAGSSVAGLTGVAAPPLQAARLAYLLLAEMGG